MILLTDHPSNLISQSTKGFFSTDYLLFMLIPGIIYAFIRKGFSYQKETGWHAPLILSIISKLIIILLPIIAISAYSRLFIVSIGEIPWVPFGLSHIWLFYLHLMIAACLVVMYACLFFLCSPKAASKCTKKLLYFTPLHKKEFCIIMIVASFVLAIYPYSRTVYPNINTNAGGGQPSLVKLIMEGEAKNLVLTFPLDSQKDKELDFSERYYWFWTKSDQNIYVTPDTLINDERLLVALKAEQVTAMQIFKKYKVRFITNHFDLDIDLRPYSAE